MRAIGNADTTWAELVSHWQLTLADAPIVSEVDFTSVTQAVEDLGKLVETDPALADLHKQLKQLHRAIAPKVARFIERPPPG